MENGTRARVPLDEAVKKHGIGRTSREAGVARETLASALNGRRIPSKATAKKIAAALGLKIEQIAWPRGYADQFEMAKSRASQREAVAEVETRLYSNEEFKQAVAEEVERRMDELGIGRAAQKEARPEA